MQNDSKIIRYSSTATSAKLRTFMLLMILFASFLNSTAQKNTGHIHNDGKEAPVSFGMRLRKSPPKIAGIYQPTIVQEAPSNGSTCVRLSGDTIKVFFINERNGANKLMSIISYNGGLTWGNPRVEFDLRGQGYFANQVIRDHSGELQCVFTLFEKGEGGYRGRLANLWYCHTGKGGKKWSIPREIFHGYVGALRGFIQLRSGRLLLAFAKAVPKREKVPPKGVIDYGWNDIISLYSDDNGRTWKPSENSLKVVSERGKSTRYGGLEPTIIELKYGKIWMLIRTNTGFLYQSYSDDGGKIWKQPQPTRFISSNSPADLLRLSNNRIILFWCSDQSWDNPLSYADGGRQVLHAAISNDNGNAWKGFREILTKPIGNPSHHGDHGTSYSSAVENKEGKVVLVSGQGEGKSIVLFDPNWLEDQSAEDNFSTGLIQWTMFGGDSATRLAYLPNKENKNALWIRKSENKKDLNTEAEWNFPMISCGEMVLEIKKNMKSKGISIALTDHFSTCDDTLANQHAVFSFSVDDKGKVWRNANENVTIKIIWDVKKGIANLYLNGQEISVSNIGHHPYYGVNYLRIGIPGDRADMAGYYVKSMKVRRI